MQSGRKPPGRPAVPEREEKGKKGRGQEGGQRCVEAGRGRAYLWMVLRSILPKPSPQLPLRLAALSSSDMGYIIRTETVSCLCSISSFSCRD